MPDKKTIERAREDRSEGKAASTQAGEFVHEEMDHIREGKHGARSTKQAIAIGLSKARRAGVDLPPPKEGAASEETRRKAARDDEAGQRGRKTVSKTRSKAISTVLKREGHAAASKPALAKQGREAAAKRTPSQRSASAKTAAKTRGDSVRKTAGKTTSGRAKTVSGRAKTVSGRAKTASGRAKTASGRAKTK